MPRQDMWVTHRSVKELEKALSKPISDVGRGETLFDKEVVFLNGFRMAIQVIAAETEGETAWTWQLHNCGSRNGTTRQVDRPDVRRVFYPHLRFTFQKVCWARLPCAAT